MFIVSCLKKVWRQFFARKNVEESRHFSQFLISNILDFQIYVQIKLHSRSNSELMHYY